MGGVGGGGGLGGGGAEGGVTHLSTRLHSCKYLSMATLVMSRKTDSKTLFKQSQQRRQTETQHQSNS